MKLKFRFLALLAVVALLCVPGTALAQPVTPLIFRGNVTIGGEPAPAGTIISAEIGGAPVATNFPDGTSVIGHYAISVPRNSNEGKMVVLKVNGVVGGQHEYIPWSEGPSVDLDLATYTLTVNVDPEGSGSVALDPADGDSITEDNQYALDTSVTLTPTANPGYGFDSWVDATPTGIDNEATVVMDGNKSVTASFISVGPVADFSASPLSGDEPLTVQFTDESLNMVDNPSWYWDFGEEGGTSTEQNPSHEYLQDGSYTVSLTVTTDEGTDTKVEDNYIIVTDTEPVASFSAEPTSGPYPLEVSFTDESISYDGITYEWDFGDGGTSTEQNPIYTYETEGTYTVALTVTEEDTDSNTITVDDLITVTAPGDVTDPVIEYACLGYPRGAESARPGESFMVRAEVTDDTAVTLVEIETPFGTFPLDVEVHDGIAIYWVVIELPEDAEFGTYELTLRAEDAAGNEATQSLELEVVPTLTAYNVWLADGWNLISLPLIPDVATTEDVTAGLSFFGEDFVRAVWGDEAADWMMPDINTVWYYDAVGQYGTAGEWLFFEPDAGVGDLTEMEDGKGYWVEVVSPVDEGLPPPILTVYGVEIQPGPQVLPPSYLVVEGWNLIGFKATHPMPVDLYLSAVEGKYARLYGYNADDQYFYLLGEAGRGDMQPGAGYWIYMTDSGYIVP